MAPITSTERGLRTEISVGSPHGLDHASFVQRDSTTTILAPDLGAHVGYLRADQEAALAEAIAAAFDLE